MKKVLLSLMAVVLLVLGTFLLGPSADVGVFPKTFPTVTVPFESLDSLVNADEFCNSYLKSDNQARIIWADSVPQKTKYAILYLPGFSATYYEAEPLHKDLAKKYHANLYLARLFEHGLDQPEPMVHLTAVNYLESAKNALSICSELADSVIILSTSTGGTLSLILAAEFKNNIAGIIMLSPNVAIYDAKSVMLSKPWGLQIAEWVKGTKYHEWKSDNPVVKKYWTTKYRLEALTQLQVLLDQKMNSETFKKVDVPVFMGYYYQNEELQDHTVSVTAMKEMFQEIATPAQKKMAVAFPYAASHVIGCKAISEQYPDVFSAVDQFYHLHFTDSKN